MRRWRGSRSGWLPDWWLAGAAAVDRFFCFCFARGVLRGLLATRARGLAGLGRLARSVGTEKRGLPRNGSQ